MTIMRSIFLVLVLLTATGCAGQMNQDYKRLLDSMGPTCETFRKKMPTLIREDEDLKKEKDPLVKGVMRGLATMAENLDQASCETMVWSSVVSLCSDFLRNPGEQEAMCHEYVDLCPHGDTERQTQVCEKVVIVDGCKAFMGKSPEQQEEFCMTRSQPCDAQDIRDGCEDVVEDNS